VGGGSSWKKRSKATKEVFWLILLQQNKRIVLANFVATKEIVWLILL
jgi:hypothetical protein